MTMFKEYVFYRESAIQSIVADSFLFVMIASLLLFNHYVLSGALLLDVIFVFMAIMVIAGRQSKHRTLIKSKEELIKFTNKILKENGTGKSVG